jgi:23S rRNA A1618 N6-methylase RlmF
MPSSRSPDDYSHSMTSPSSTSSPTMISTFILPCNFHELAKHYPHFQRALRELQQRQQSKQDDDETKSLAAQITHRFNATLTRSLLHQQFGLEMPSLPAGRLCPPVPNRANYVAWLRELLLRSEKELCCFSGGVEVEKKWQHQGIDIGTGVSAIYPLLLTTRLFAASGGGSNSQTYPPWRFLATDIDPVAVQSARENVEANRLEDRICVVPVENEANSNTLRSDATSTLSTSKGPLFAAMDEAKHNPMFQRSRINGASLAAYLQFDFVMTNPPFYSTTKEATDPRAGDKRSRTDMSFNEGVYVQPISNAFDIDEGSSGKCDLQGGDVGFVTAIMKDSQFFRHRVTWYTSLLAKRSSLDALLQQLHNLDGVWGNRGQIRTVEFRQRSDIGDGNDGTRESDSSSPRVRWGIGWTYERAVGRCSVCRVLSGLQSFNVLVEAVDATFATEEVVSRLVVYFESIRGIGLKCTDQARRSNSTSKLKRCVTVVEERFHSCSPSSPLLLNHDRDNINLPYEGHFVMDGFVHAMDGDYATESDVIKVQVSLEMYSHTRHGRALLDKIRGQMVGEIGRTNRRWRRLMKKNGIETTG